MKKVATKNYELFIQNNNKFKYNTLTFVYNIPYKKEDLSYLAIMKGYLIYTNRYYREYYKIAREFEKLYGCSLNFSYNKTDDVINFQMHMKILKEKYINEDILEKSLDLAFTLLNSPYVENDAFADDTIELCKNEIIAELKSMEENMYSLSFNHAIKYINSDSSLSVHPLGTIEEINKINGKDLYEFYLKFFKRAALKVFAFGNFNEQKLKMSLNKNINYEYSKNTFIKRDVKKLNIKNPKDKLIEKGHFSQSQLLVFYEIINTMDKKEKYATRLVFNHLFGTPGTMDTKLFKHLRVENSLCYGVSANIYGGSNFMLVKTGISKANLDLAVKLIGESLEEMQKGDFSDKDLSLAKNKIVSNIKSDYDFPQTYLNDLTDPELYCDVITTKEQIELVKEVNKEDVMNFAKKFKHILTYMLEEEQDGN